MWQREDAQLPARLLEFAVHSLPYLSCCPEVPHCPEALGDCVSAWQCLGAGVGRGLRVIWVRVENNRNTLPLPPHSCGVGCSSVLAAASTIHRVLPVLELSRLIFLVFRYFFVLSFNLKGGERGREIKIVKDRLSAGSNAGDSQGWAGSQEFSLGLPGRGQGSKCWSHHLLLPFAMAGN